MARTRLFFATDVHGSLKVMQKFVWAGKFYKVDVLVLGGDITGKAVVPIVALPDGSYQVKVAGTLQQVQTEEELKQLETRLQNMGNYIYRTSPEEMNHLSSNVAAIGELFSRVMTESIQNFLRHAKEYLKRTGIQIYVQAGNDDPLTVRTLLNESDFAINPEEKVVEIDKFHEMISLGHSNLTPWNCPGDIPEEKLRDKIEHLASQVTKMDNCIFNLHCPPFDTELDIAPELDESLTVIFRQGRMSMVSVGSTAVRESIEEHQPLLGLHGHIHESRGAFKIGRTVCINPGSEYSEGVLRGVIINLYKKGMKGYQFVSG
ncbi:MAG: metallophosphoesterase [Candidatus Heimdallarchaeota archaeon]